MVFRLQKGKSVELNLEYLSFMKKPSYALLQALAEATKSDPATNFHLKLQDYKQQALAVKAPPPADEDPKKAGGKAGGAGGGAKAAAEKKKTKKELEEEEERKRREQEERLAREEEEARRVAEAESQFDLPRELAKLGGKMEDFEVEGFQSQHYSWLIPCFFKPADEPETARSTMYLEVTSVTTSKILIADKSEINFGEIAVGFRKVEELLITNLGKTQADLSMDLLPLLGGFNVLNALKSIPPGKTRNVVLQFEPYNQQEFKSSHTKQLFDEATTNEDYRQTLTIRSGQSSISVRLKGSSVKPEVTVNPADGLLDMGATLPNERLEKSFEVRNASNFALDFDLKLLSSGIRRTDGQQAFMFIPSKGNLRAGETLQVRAIFNPDRVSEEYHSFIKVDVPNQKTERFIYLRGACFPRQAYVCHFKPFEKPREEDLNMTIEHPLDFIRQRDSTFIIGSENKSMLLEFPKIPKATAKDSPLLEKKIVVGNCKLGDVKSEKPATFDFNLLVGCADLERRELGLLRSRKQQGVRACGPVAADQGAVQAD